MGEILTLVQLRRRLSTFRSAATYFPKQLIPLETKGRRDRASRRRNFFRELLPEGQILTDIARNAGVAEYDTIELLDHAGRDVAGALQIYDPVKAVGREPKAVPLTTDEVRELLIRTRQKPLGNDPISGKSSLAGVQDKIVLALRDFVWHQCLDGYPSTHILKPENKRRPDLIYNEAFCLTVARSLGIAEYETHVATLGDLDALLIERYDRIMSDDDIERIHQEDALQALGVPRENKYQEIGGQISLKRIAELFVRRDDTRSLELLLQYVAFSVAIGNLDLHGKNVSLLHEKNRPMRIAPAYDLVPHTHYEDSDGRLALSINGKYLHASITSNDIREEAISWGMDPEAIRAILMITFDLLPSFVEGIDLPDRAHPNLKADILRFVANLKAGREVGHLP